jgi:outer membrane receptor protein involved in Fe transport
MQMSNGARTQGFQPGLLGAAVTAAILTVSDVAQAQLEEVIVTATRRAESMQDVAISMLSTGGDAISDMGITRGRNSQRTSRR